MFSRHCLTTLEPRARYTLNVIKQRPSFDAPQEAEWHRMIAEAAYYLAQKRGFLGEYSLDDWLAAEQQVRQVISPIPNSEVTMSDTTRHSRAKPEAKAVEATAKAGNPGPQEPRQSQHGQPALDGVSRFERFAATQAAGDGVEGDVLKPDKTVDEKLGANMADRK